MTLRLSVSLARAAVTFNIARVFDFFSPPPSPLLKLYEWFNCLEVQHSELLRLVLKAAGYNVCMGFFVFVLISTRAT